VICHVSSREIRTPGGVDFRRVIVTGKSGGRDARRERCDPIDSAKHALSDPNSRRQIRRLQRVGSTRIASAVAVEVSAVMTQLMRAILAALRSGVRMVEHGGAGMVTGYFASAPLPFIASPVTSRAGPIGASVTSLHRPLWRSGTINGWYVQRDLPTSCRNATSRIFVPLPRKGDLSVRITFSTGGVAGTRSATRFGA
jgi:hypothetical protein